MAAAVDALCRCMNISVLVLLLLVYFAQSLSFDMRSIDHRARVKFDVEGDAYIDTQGLQLTPNEGNKTGRATYKEPFHLWDKKSGDLAADFSTSFSFVIDSNGSLYYADGMAFFLANFSTTLNKNQNYGSGLGLVDHGTQKSPDPFVAVEFHTFPSTTVSINIVSMQVISISKPWKNSISSWNRGSIQGIENTANISYSSISKILHVDYTGFWDGEYLTDSLVFNVDLREELSEFVSVGFSAGTGDFSEKHSVTSWRFDSTSPRRSSNSNSKKMKKGVVIGLSVGILVLVFVSLFVLAVYLWFKKKNQAVLGRRSMDTEFERAGSGAKRYSYRELRTATNNFVEKLGEGGFGTVFRGFLRDINMAVAVKRISGQTGQGISEYVSEVKIISRLRHRNLVPLLGWCHENEELMLVYECMPGGSLDYHLFKKDPPLNWNVRRKIVRGLASALSYLHEEWEQCVLHRDIKSSNVLLDSNFNARLGDFGMACLLDHEKTAIKTMSGWTPGYVAPECHSTLRTSKESDVYSFGVVVLEISCGRRSILPNEPEGVVTLVDWVWDEYESGRLIQAADPKLSGQFEEQELERLMIIGLWCTHPDFKARPKINEVVHFLTSEVQLPSLPAKMPVIVYSTSHGSLLGSSSAPHSSGVETTSSSHNSQLSRFTSSSAGSATHSHAL